MPAPRRLIARSVPADTLTDQRAHTLRGTRLGAVVRTLNPLVRALLASPLHWPLSRWFLLLSWIGPQTGRPHATPVSYVLDDGNVYATTGDSWWHNVVRAPEVTVRIRGRAHHARVVPIENADRSVAEHERLFERHPFFRRLARMPAGKGGHPDRQTIRGSVEAGRTLLVIDIVD
jgi:deazaflavin-dependent oxidoreductase (nitroreductase family)